jgi:ATP-binding cassette, subfamily B, bacterial
MTSSTATKASPDRATGRQVWRQLWTTSRPLSVALVGWIVLNAVAPAAVVASLGLVVGAVPAAIKDGMGSAAGAVLIVALVVAAAIYGLSLILDTIGNAIGTAASARVTGRLQARLLTAVSGPVGIEHLEDASVLDRLARAEGSLTGYFPGDAPVTWAGILASRIAGLVGCVIVGFFYWWLGILLFVMWLLVRRLMLRVIVRQATEMRGQTSTMRRAWYLAGIGSKARDSKEVRVFGLANFIAERFGLAYHDTMSSASKGMRDVHARATIGFGIVLVGYLIALGVIVDGVLTHSLDVQKIAILVPMLTVTMSAGSVSLDDITLTWTLAAIPDVDRLEEDLAARSSRLGGVEELGDRPRRSVRFEGVAFHYPSATSDVLRGVDLDLEVGTSTAIVGVNGAGKSTLVSLLSRLHDPSSGRITVDGADIRDLAAVQWQRAIAVMPQDPAHFPVSAYDNIAYGSIEHRDDRSGVEECARLSGFVEVVPTLPNGWDTILSRSLPGGVDLSGGQWQRLALARALFATRHGARVLVLDEPTAALDVRSEARFYERFLEITEGLTTVVISHRFGTVRRADSICVLQDGRISERGSHEDLLAAGGAYAHLYSAQARQFGGAR